MFKGQNKETHEISLGQETENSSVYPLPALSYVLTLIPMGQHPETQEFSPLT